jgi:hypothetical protein
MQVFFAEIFGTQPVVKPVSGAAGQ